MRSLYLGSNNRIILINEIISENQEINEEIELLDFKYKLIDELINFRKSYKLSQAEFADMIKVDKQMISRFEKGEIDPRLSFIEKVLHGINSKAIIDNKTYIKLNKAPEFE